MSHRRKQAEKRRLEKLYAATKHKCRGGAYYDDNKGRIIRYSIPNNSWNSKKLCKRYSNKRLRQAKPMSLKGNKYRRVFDYWWELL